MTHKEQFDDLTVPSGGTLSLNSNVDAADIDLSITPTWTGAHTFDAGLTLGGPLDVDNNTLDNVGYINNTPGTNLQLQLNQSDDTFNLLDPNGDPYLVADENGINLRQGGFNAGTDRGIVQYADMQISSTPTAGDQHSLYLSIDDNAFLKLYAEADGAGATQNEELQVLNVDLTDGSNTIYDRTNGRIGSGLVDATSLDLSIAPTWTGTHTFSANPAVVLDDGRLRFENPDGAVDQWGVLYSNNDNLIFQNENEAVMAFHEGKGAVQIENELELLSNSKIEWSTPNPGAIVAGGIQIVDGNSAAGTEHSMLWSIDGVGFLKTYAESDGAGGIQNAEVRVPNHDVNLQGGDLQRNGTTVVSTQESAIASLTNNLNASTDGTLAEVSESGDDTTINNNLTELNSKIDSILTALRNHGLIAS
jgi:hypothetical protein